MNASVVGWQHVVLLTRDQDSRAERVRKAILTEEDSPWQRIRTHNSGQEASLLGDGEDRQLRSLVGGIVLQEKRSSDARLNSSDLCEVSARHEGCDGAASERRVREEAGTGEHCNSSESEDGTREES